MINVEKMTNDIMGVAQKFKNELYETQKKYEESLNSLDNLVTIAMPSTVTRKVDDARDAVYDCYRNEMEQIFYRFQREIDVTDIYDYTE